MRTFAEGRREVRHQRLIACQTERSFLSLFNGTGVREATDNVVSLR